MRLEDGDDVSAEEICRDNPDLYLAFLARMEELRAANLTLAVLAASASPPEIPGYRILNELGRGGSAVVYRAIQLEMDREVAVKVFFPQLQDKGFFDREIAAIKRLTHECIPVVFECGSLSFGNSLLCWFSMELLSGGVVKKAKVCQKPTADILRLFKKIVEAVQYAHTNGVLHRDIKPANILLDEAGIPHVADFGIAKVGSAIRIRYSDNGGVEGFLFVESSVLVEVKFRCRYVKKVGPRPWQRRGKYRGKDRGKAVESAPW